MAMYGKMEKKTPAKKGAAKKAAGMTASQKKLPPFIQKAIAAKKAAKKK
jgi:hypothetical protein